MRLLLIISILFPALLHSQSGFRMNSGQILNQDGDPNLDAKYVLQCKGYNVQLRQNGFSYDLITNQQENNLSIHRIDFNLQNFNQDYTVVETYPDTKYPNRFLIDGNQLQRSTVTYKNIYKGIDLLFKRKGLDEFEYDFIIHENGNINDILFSIQGTNHIECNSKALLISLENKQFNETIPHSYFSDGSTAEVVFQEKGKHQYGFYSNSKQSGLLIDPTPNLLYATYWLGNTGTVSDIQYLTNFDYLTFGQTSSSFNFATSGSFQSTLAGQTNAVLTYFNADNSLQWSTYFGSDNTTGQFIDVKNNKIICTGITNSTNLSSENVFQSSLGGNYDTFVSSFDLSGDFLWCSYLGGAQDDYPTDITFTNNQNFIVCGYTSSSNFPIFNSTSDASGAQDGFICIFDSETNECQYSTLIGGSEADYIVSISTNSQNEIAFVGHSYSNSFSQTPSNAYPEFLLNSNPQFDKGFFGKFDSSFNLEILGYINAGVSGSTFQIESNQLDNWIILGLGMSDNNIITTNAEELNPFNNLSYGDYLMILNPDLSVYYCSFYGFNLSDARLLAISTQNEIYVGTSTFGAENISSENAFQELYLMNPESPSNLNDGALFKFDNTGQKTWGTYFGTYANDGIYGLSIQDSRIAISGGLASFNEFSTPYQESFITPDAIFNEMPENSTGFVAIFDLTTSVVEATLDSEFGFFPNPTEGKIRLNSPHFENQNIIIFDVTGKKIFQTSIRNQEIDLSSLPAGMYQAVISKDNLQFSTRIIKQ